MRKIIKKLICIQVLLVVAKIRVNSADYTSAAVHGTLKCKGQPAGGELMIIIDETRNIHKALEHAIGRGVSLSDGSFLISARFKGQMDPVIKVYHFCGTAEIRCCYVKISEGSVTEGKTPQKVLDMGTVDLDTFFSTPC